MEQSLAESPRLQLRDDDFGLLTVAKVISAVERIVAVADPQRVVAFGSRPRGDHRRDSDLDLAVIVDKYDPKVDKRPIWRANLDEWMDMDILVYDAEREWKLGDSPISLQHESYHPVLKGSSGLGVFRVRRDPSPASLAMRLRQT